MQYKRSLQSHFRIQAIKWSVFSFGLIVLISVPSFYLLVKGTLEKQSAVLAESAVKSFGFKITADGNIRNLEPQIAESLNLGPDESVRIRDPQFKLIYNDGLSPQPLSCGISKKSCWINFHQIERLEPIYFDSEKKELFGYLDLRTNVAVNRAQVAIFIMLIFLIFIVQTLGLSKALGDSSESVISSLANWARLLRQPPTHSSAKTNEAPFSEFIEMQNAIDGLQFEIKKYQKIAVQDAKSGLQLSILKEISHDLRTPLSQLTKFFAVLVMSTRRVGHLDELQVERIERTLKKVGNIAGLVKNLQLDLSEENQCCAISDEARNILEDFKTDPEVMNRNLVFNFEPLLKDSMVRISPTAFQRILDNLIKNAIDASPVDSEIKISLVEESGAPTLMVSDQGKGIKLEHFEKVYDFDFSTKESRGTGLGLGIVKQLCLAYGAHISFESEINRGTKFKISFLPFLTEQHA